MRELTRGITISVEVLKFILFRNHADCLYIFDHLSILNWLVYYLKIITLHLRKSLLR